jgi:hypothetical protein
LFRTSLFSVIFIFIFPFMTMKPNAASPPSEIEKAKQEAPLHVIGTVTSDQMYKDITEENETPVQIRKMNLDVKQVLKAPTTETLTTVDIFYTYIPSWQAYSGAKRMDIAVGDVIEIWLKKGEYGWESALSREYSETYQVRRKSQRADSRTILAFYKAKCSQFG